MTENPIHSVLLMHNPISGSGKAADASSRLLSILRSSGLSVMQAPTVAGSPTPDVIGKLMGVDLVVVIGGDGAVRSMAPVVAETGTPVYQFPMGTENLFAREFGMNRDPARLMRTIREGHRQAIDAGIVNGQWFLLMVSIGLDADIVHDLASVRNGAITHMSYTLPIARQMMAFQLPRVTVDVDDETIVDHQQGNLVIANCRQYATRLDPCLNARVDDAVLDICFMPCESRLGLAKWVVASRFRAHMSIPGLVYRRGSSIQIRSDEQFAYQIDGDPSLPGNGHVSTDHKVTELDITVQPATINVLVPPDYGDNTVQPDVTAANVRS